MKKSLATIKPIQTYINHDVSINNFFHQKIIHKHNFVVGTQKDPLLNYLLQKRFAKPIKNDIKVFHHKTINLFNKHNYNKIYNLKLKMQNKILLSSQSDYYYSKNINKRREIKTNNVVINRYRSSIIDKKSLLSNLNYIYLQNKNIKEDNKNINYNISNNQIDYQNLSSFEKFDKDINNSNLFIDSNYTYSQHNNIKQEFKDINYYKKLDFIKLNKIISNLNLLTNSNAIYPQNKNIEYKKRSNFIDIKNSLQKIGHFIYPLKTTFLQDKSIDKKLEKNSYLTSIKEKKYTSKDSIILYKSDKYVKPQTENSTNIETKRENINFNSNKNELFQNSTSEIRVGHLNHYEIKKLANKIYPMIMKQWQKEFEKRGVFHG